MFVIDPISDAKAKVAVHYNGGIFKFRRPNEKQMIGIHKATKSEDIERQGKLILDLLDEIEQVEFKGDKLTKDQVLHDPEFPGALKFKLIALAAESLLGVEEKNA